jgi:hypothetical protein
MAFLLRPDYGLKILEDNGQKTIVSTEPYYEKNIPQQLKGFLK